MVWGGGGGQNAVSGVHRVGYRRGAGCGECTGWGIGGGQGAVSAQGGV